MAADAYVQDADMKKVADAIRAKTGTTGTIVFPDGFVGQIEGMVEPKLIITKQPTGGQYKNYPPDTTGMIVKMITSDGESEVKNYTVAPEKWPNEVGRKTLTVYFAGLSVTTSVVVENSPVWGVKIELNNSSPSDSVSYIDSARGFTPMTADMPGSWEGNELIQGIKPVACMSNSDGKIWINLDKRDFSKSLNLVTNKGGVYDIYTKFPTLWLSITSDSQYCYIRFCREKADDTYTNLASYYKGSDQGCFYLGCYHSRIAYDKGTTRDYLLYSAPGLKEFKPATGYISQLQEWTQNNYMGTFEDNDIESWPQHTYILALFIVLFKTLDGQSVLGSGYTSGSGYDFENIYTFTNDYGMTKSANGTSHMSFFWLNDLWGNTMSEVGGVSIHFIWDDCVIRLQEDGLKTINVSNESDFKAPAVKYRISPQSRGYVRAMLGTTTNHAFIPKATNGSSITYYCDCVSPPSTNSFRTIVGSYFNSGTEGGPFSARFSQSTSESCSVRKSYRSKIEGI